MSNTHDDRTAGGHVQTPAEITACKREVRQTMRARLAALGPQEASLNSMNAASHVLASAEWHAASAVYLFVSLPEEIDTRLLLNAAWQEGKQVFLPKVTAPKEGEMLFFSCASRAELVSGPFGISEPAGPGAVSVQPGPGSLIIVPGLVFSRQGHRLGRGGGYYDRFFAAAMALDPRRFDRATRIGFCFHMQVLDEVPTTARDIPLHGLCTENGLNFF